MDSDANKPADPADQPVVYDLFISLVAILSLVIVAGLMILDEQTEMSLMLSYMDLAICVIFFIDFLRNLALAPNKQKYLLGWGLLDLAASVPAIGAFRFFRLARLIRVIRAVKSVRVLHSTIHRDRRNALLALVMFVVISGIMISCVGVLYFENLDPKANIKTAADALWWSVCTASTVGYGDYYPVSTGGRLFAVLLMSLGIGTFASFAGVMTDLVRQLGKESKTSSRGA